MPHASRLLDYASRGLIVKRKEPRAAFSSVLVERRRLSGSAAHNPLRRVQHHLPHHLGVGLLVRTQQRLLIPPAPGFHHVAHRVAVPFGGPLPAAPGELLRARIESFTKGTFTAMVVAVRPQAIAKQLLDAQTVDQGIADLDRTANCDDAFFYTFFKGTATLA